MRNRAKCRICLSIIESCQKDDVVTCKCGQITIEGGTEYYGAFAVDFANFLRVDDDGKEIEVKYHSKASVELLPSKEESKPTRQELIQSLAHMMESIERLPDHALSTPINHYDFYSLGSLLLALLRADIE